MDEYIEREVAKKMLDEYRISRTMSMYGDMDLLMEWREGVKCSMKKLDEVPAADVVPKSEVDELIRENKSLAKTVNEASELLHKLRSKVEKSKAEVAREIFEEIKKIFVHRLLHSRDAIDDISGDLDELKKKYVKGCRTCKHLVSCEPNPFGSCDEYTEGEK